MRLLLLILPLVFPATLMAQVDSLQFKADRLRLVTDMPYICRTEGQRGCGGRFFWDVVKEGEKIIPYLLQKLDDTTKTFVTNFSLGDRYRTGDVAYIALQEIIHDIPTLELAGISYDEQCGYCSFWKYIGAYENRKRFKEVITDWYNRNKENLTWMTAESFETCDCTVKHPVGGHYVVGKP